MSFQSVRFGPVPSAESNSSDQIKEFAVTAGAAKPIELAS